MSFDYISVLLGSIKFEILSRSFFGHNLLFSSVPYLLPGISNPVKT